MYVIQVIQYYDSDLDLLSILLTKNRIQSPSTVPVLSEFLCVPLLSTLSVFHFRLDTENIDSRELEKEGVMKSVRKGGQLSFFPSRRKRRQFPVERHTKVNNAEGYGGDIAMNIHKFM